MFKSSTGGASALRSLQVLARVGDLPAQRAGGHGERAGQVDTRLLVAHAAGEVAVGGADAAQGLVETAERVAGPAQAGGAGRRPELGAGRQEHLLQRLAVEPLRLQ